MKMNLKVNVAVSGNIVVTHKSNRENMFGSHPEKHSRDSRESIDLNGLVFDISMEESVDDISPKEYIQAVGAAMKDVVSGIFQKREQPKEELKMGDPGWYEQEVARMEQAHNARIREMDKAHKDELTRLHRSIEADCNGCRLNANKQSTAQSMYEAAVRKFAATQE